jgi:hypothetical protein
VSHLSNAKRDALATREFAGLLARGFRGLSYEEAGAAPAYDDLYATFIERGLLIKNSGPMPETRDIHTFVEARKGSMRVGRASFHEIVLFATTEVFGNVGHRFSAYAKSGTSQGKPFATRGVISTQFVLTPDGWKISVMAWDDERPGLSVKERYEPTEFAAI